MANLKPLLLSLRLETPQGHCPLFFSLYMRYSFLLACTSPFFLNLKLIIVGNLQQQLWNTAIILQELLLWKQPLLFIWILYALPCGDTKFSVPFL